MNEVSKGDELQALPAGVERLGEHIRCSFDRVTAARSPFLHPNPRNRYLVIVPLRDLTSGVI